MENFNLQEAFARLFRSLCKVQKLQYADWKAFMDRTAIAQFKANEVVTEAGTLSTHSYFIISGLMMCYDGHEPKHMIWFGAEHYYAFTIDMFNYSEIGNTNTQTVVALEDTIAFSISHADFLWLQEHHHKITLLRNNIIFRSAFTINKIQNCLLVNARDRYEWIQDLLGFQLARIPAVYLAPYVRVTPKRLKELLNSKPVDFLTRY
jgi:hypothetical protein